MENFTPYSAAAGGALIGLGAALLLLLNGRIAGISGIVSGALSRPAGDTQWRLLFIAGLVLGVGAIVWTMPLPFTPRTGFSPAILVLAGLLVGFGSRLGSGCTSGHGVCGLARFSPRSLVATLTFMTTGIATVYVVRHLAGA
ncbi:MAG: YeeE/YedE family protein [Proteobacteria bacterium]|jgi:uncharacterized protein|nr:YeeE/YedE family protein [Pseudomonadota bacterium]